MTKLLVLRVISGTMVLAVAGLMPVSAFATTLNSSNVSISNVNIGFIGNSTYSHASTGGNSTGGSRAGRGGSGGDANITGTGPSTCGQVTTTVVSDTSTLVVPGNTPAAAVSTINPGWTASIAGATWIWNVDPQPSPVVFPQTVAFEKTFTVPGTVISATLDVAADNTYTGNVNGTAVDNSANPIGDANTNNFQLATQDTYNVVNAITSGSNTVHIEVTNTAGSTDPLQNPGGLLYKLVVTSNSCTPGSSNTGGGTGGNGGAGGNSGNGGLVITGDASSTSGTVNVQNINKVRVR